MFHLSAILFAFATIATINALPIWEDADGNSYLLVPVDQDQVDQVQHRNRRQATGFTRETTYDFGNNHAGLGQKLSFDNDNHKFSAHTYAGRDYKPKGPLTTGNTAEYLHKPSGSEFKVNAENTRGMGTDLSASGTYNFFQTQDKRGKVGVGGEYERHYGGRPGTSDPKYNVFVKGTYDF